MTLWTAQDAAAATGGRATADWAAEGISIDTRTLRPGDLFVALKDARDGHDFVAQALERGPPPRWSAASPRACPRCAAAAGPRCGARAGGVGPRRPRPDPRAGAGDHRLGWQDLDQDMAAAALAPLGRVHAAEASLNNHWGVPLTLARMPADTDFAILELGMNHPGEIAPLSRMARPHVAMITTVAPAHMEAFGSLDGIAAEKASIFEGLEPGGHAIIPQGLGSP